MRKPRARPARICHDPELTGNLGNIALLKIAADLDLISVNSAERCPTAYREFRRMQHSLRLNGAQFARVAPQQAAAHAQALRDLWGAVLAPMYLNIGKIHEVVTES